MADKPHFLDKTVHTENQWQRLKASPAPCIFHTGIWSVHVHVCVCVNLTVTKNNDIPEPRVTKCSPIFIKTSLS